MSRVTSWLIVVILAAAAPVSAQTRDVGAMITEIKPGRGRIEVSGPGTVDWRPAGPLLALKVGDSLRVVAGSSVLLERSGLTGSRLAYPADAPALVPGTAYTLQLYSGQSVVDEVRFEVADRQRADDLRRDLREVDQALGADVPASSRAVMQAGLLARRRVLPRARPRGVGALTTRTEQPSPPPPPGGPHSSIRPAPQARS